MIIITRWLAILSSATAILRGKESAGLSNSSLLFIVPLEITFAFSDSDDKVWASLISTISTRTRLKKLEPSRSTLVAQTLPPIASLKLLQMARPRPVPPYLRVVELSPCENGMKRREISSGDIPIPVSRTSNSSSTELHSESILCVPTSKDTSPDLVNLIAFESRFKRICLNLVSSPLIFRGTVSSTLIFKLKPFSVAWDKNIEFKLLIMGKIEKSRNSRLRWPDSTFEKSSTSFISDIRASLLLFILIRKSSCSSFSLVSSSNSTKPIMPLSGVRISWLIVARKSLFARFALSAAWVARVACSIIWFRRSFVTSSSFLALSASSIILRANLRPFVNSLACSIKSEFVEISSISARFQRCSVSPWSLATWRKVSDISSNSLNSKVCGISVVVPRPILER